MQNISNKITALITLFAIVVNFQLAYGASGRRKHFLSHGPSVCAFGAGETVFAAYKDPAVIQYNSALLAYLGYNSFGLSRFNLFEGSSYNSGSAAVKVTQKIFLGLSVSDLSSGKVETRENIYSVEKVISTNIWDYVLSMSGFSDFFKAAYGINIKYLYYDLYYKKGGAGAVDCGIAKNIPLADIFDIKLGLSIQNFFAGKINIDYASEDIPVMFILSSALIFPLYYRFRSKDTINIYADIKYEDSFADFHGGFAYIIADKYCIRGGYYPRHFTVGLGIEFCSFAVDYAADFSEIDLINRLSVNYRWGYKKSSDFDGEAKLALDKENENIKRVKEKFKKAKRLYSKQEYFRASDILSDILTSYPNFESPKHFYKQIKSRMKKTAEQEDELDFDKIIYARSYVNYYNAKYKEALNDWKKYINFKGENEEIKEYSDKIDSEIKLAELEKRELELKLQAERLCEEGVKKYDEGKWVVCIKKMENLQKFVTKNNFSKSIEYCNKAKEYINKAVVELSKNVDNSKVMTTESSDYDELAANDKYIEGLVLYAQGKYYEAERAWELTLRLNPNHKKSKIALRKLKDFLKE
jgi:tetratricopeptide (TPR) repeat protein